MAGKIPVTMQQRPWLPIEAWSQKVSTSEEIVGTPFGNGGSRRCTLRTHVGALVHMVAKMTCERHTAWGPANLKEKKTRLVNKRKQ